MKTFTSLFFILPAMVYSTDKQVSSKTSNRAVEGQEESWTVLETHGLMLSHYPLRRQSVNGGPIIARRDDEVSLFSSSLSGLTSSDEDFISWDDALVAELRDAPLHGSAHASRDVATRAGLVHLTRRASGPDAIKLEALTVGAASGPASIAPKRMAKRSLAWKRGVGKKAIPEFSSKDVQSLVDANTDQLDVMKGAIIQTKITWYTGDGLLNPYCAQKSGWTPTDDSMIIAVTQEWATRPKCGDFLELVVVDKHVGQVGKSVIARVVDLCGGCAPQVPHADLSKAAFTRLFNLDVGVVSGLAMRRVPPPKKWNDQLYGPRDL